MDLNSISVEDKVYNEDKSLVLIKGIENPKLKGCIFNPNSQSLISASFMDVENVDYNPATFKNYFSEQANNTISLCYEGPLVILRFDEKGKMHFYNTKRLDCRNSFWGNKNEKFGELFMDNGGARFVDSVEKIPSISHHFMIMTPSLMTTTRADFRNNQCIVVYLGSVSLDGTILNPEKLSPDVYYYHKISNNNFYPTREEVAGRILVPTRITLLEAEHILKNGYDFNQLSGKIDKSQFCGECVILRINNRKIIKFIPECYKLRSFIAGSVPNVKNRLYTILELSKDLEKYHEQFPIVGSLEKECIEALKQTSKTDTTKNLETFLETFDNYVDERITDRMNNIFLVCILSCPLSKVDLFIDGWFSYLSCKETIVKFIKEKNGKIRSGFYDNRLMEFHNKALERIKNIAQVSKEYATTEKNKYPYVSRLEYSIKGMVRNEFGPSLYRIEKAIKFIKDNTESVAVAMES